MPWRCSPNDLESALRAALCSAGHDVTVDIDQPSHPGADVTVAVHWTDGPTRRQVQQLARATLGSERYVDDTGTRRRADVFLCSGYTATIEIERKVSVALRARLVAVGRARHTHLHLSDDAAVVIPTDELSGYERVLATLIADATATGPRTLAPDTLAKLETTARLLVTNDHA